MQRSTDRILTTHVGSLPRPEDLKGMLLSGASTGSAGQRAAFDARVAQAVSEVVTKQVNAGIDVVSDGEQSKPSFMDYVTARIEGFSGQGKTPIPGDAAEAGGLPGAPPTTPACDGPIRYVADDAYQKDIANLKAAIDGVSIAEAFMTAVSPGTLAQVFENQHYASRGDYLSALAGAMQREYHAIADAGLVLQLDAPDIAMEHHLNHLNSPLEEYRSVVARNIEVLNAATQGIPTEQIRVHLCWGNYPGPHHLDIPLQEIIDLVLELRCGAVSFEAANPRHGHEWRVWEDVTIPDDLLLLPGVIDTRSTYVEHPELIAERIEKFASIVGPTRIIASTDCGFGTVAYAQEPEWLAYKKLEALSEGAALASERLF